MVGTYWNIKFYSMVDCRIPCSEPAASKTKRCVPAFILPKSSSSWKKNVYKQLKRLVFKYTQLLSLFFSLYFLLGCLSARINWDPLAIHQENSLVHLGYRYSTKNPLTKQPMVYNLSNCHLICRYLLMMGVLGYHSFWRFPFQNSKLAGKSLDDDIGWNLPNSFKEKMFGQKQALSFVPKCKKTKFTMHLGKSPQTQLWFEDILRAYSNPILSSTKPLSSKGVFSRPPASRITYPNQDRMVSLKTEDILEQGNLTFILSNYVKLGGGKIPKLMVKMWMWSFPVSGGINYLPTGAGFLISTVCLAQCMLKFSL